MVPIMYLVSGTLRESPQWTHHWNIMNFGPATFPTLNDDMTVTTDPIPEALPGRTLVRFHIPIFGGWRDYVVFEPCENRAWYLGWTIGPSAGGGASRILLSGPVRALRGPGSMCFFGIDADTREQIPIKLIGKGRIGDLGEFSKVKLL